MQLRTYYNRVENLKKKNVDVQTKYSRVSNTRKSVYILYSFIILFGLQF